MAKDSILLGEVAARVATMIEIRCGRCDRRGRLSVQRQIGECPRRDSAQLRCNPYSPTLVQLFGTPEPG